MPKTDLRILCFMTILCIVQRSHEHGIPRRSFLSRRAIDGTRGRKYFDPNEDGSFDSYGSAGGHYDPYDHITDLSDIRKNVPGEPGIDYPAYTTLPQTGFTCEGRSRGYYADEAAGCQVFHVCHDVLVSSFLCPIGSTFSQKLLTCDWWTKVDCSATRRYIGLNHDSYQIDDDEMIRNAYAMISLQTSAEAVTKDGLVDPDSGTRIIDYSALSGRTAAGMAYTPGFRRITDYAAVEATGNDLPSGFDNYPQQDARQILNYDHGYQQKRVNAAYSGKPHFMENKGRSPYHASAIIRHDYQDRSGDDDGFTNGLQTSYAPTVPTVTTTTRRFYSPTVPTTYRPSTLAYSKLDLLVDSSDHLYAHSKSPVTPPTITHRNSDMRKIDFRESETRRDDLKKSENASSSKMNKGDRISDDVRSKSDKVHLDFERTSETSFRINVTDAIDEDEVFRQQNDRPVIQIDNEDSLEYMEVKDSIGIARAFNNNPLGRILIQNQNLYQVSQNEQKDSTTPALLQTVLTHSPKSYEKVDAVNETHVFNETNVSNQSTEDYKDVLTSTSKSFGNRTTPLLKHWEHKDVVQASTVPMTLAISTTETNVDEIHSEITAHSSSNSTRIGVEDQSSSPTGSISNFNDESVHNINLNFQIPQPSQFLKPPMERFLINVPEETNYTRTYENSKTFWNSETTTEIPQFSSTFRNNEDQSPVYDEIDYTDEGLSEAPNPRVDLTAQVITTPIPWLVSTWRDRSLVNIPVTDIVPPIVDYNDGFNDFIPPNEHSYTAQFDHTESTVNSQETYNSSATSNKNDSEANVLVRHDTESRFNIKDAIKIQKESETTSRCYFSVSDKQRQNCETNSVTPKIAVSTASINERTVSVGTKATTGMREHLSVPSSTEKLSEESVTFIPNESPTVSTVQSSSKINDDIDIEDSHLKTITPKGVFKSSEEKIGQTVTTTVSNLFHSIRPESFEKIDETIDKHDSPYKISVTVKKSEDLETTADDFVRRLIAHHQRSDPIAKDELNDFEILKSVEPETKSILQVPKLSNISRTPPDNANSNSYIVENDTVSEFQQPDLNMSMVSLLELMAELLKLDRLPRPFSAKDLRNVKLKDSFNMEFDESSYDTESPLLNPQIRPTYNIVNTEAPTFDTLKTPAKVTESKASQNRKPQHKASLATESPQLNLFQIGTPSENADSVSSLDNVSINVDLNPPLLDVSSKVNNNATEQKTGQLKRRRIARPHQKEKILEQLTENFGQPLYRGDSVHKLPAFDLPQVQRSLDFETGLPIEESEDVTSEIEGISSIATMMTTTQKTTTTTEDVKTTIETEFVPSLGFSLDTNEGREEYVQAVLGGLIDDHTDASESSRNKSSIEQIKIVENATVKVEQ